LVAVTINDRQGNAKNREMTQVSTEGRGREFYKFQTAEIAPPRGDFAVNYARYCHNESNAHRWCFAWTTEHNPPADRGGNFYVANCGIKVESSKNMFAIYNKLLGLVSSGTMEVVTQKSLYSTSEIRRLSTVWNS
jgi:hypothetical protein